MYPRKANTTTTTTMRMIQPSMVASSHRPGGWHGGHGGRQGGSVRPLRVVAQLIAGLDDHANDELGAVHDDRGGFGDGFDQVVSDVLGIRGGRRPSRDGVRDDFLGGGGRRCLNISVLHV